MQPPHTSIHCFIHISRSRNNFRAGGICMTLNHIGQEHYSCLGFQYKKAGQTERETSFSKEEEQKENELDFLNRSFNSFRGLSDQSFQRVWLHLELLLKMESYSVFGSVPFLSVCPTYSLHTGPTSREIWANLHEPRTCWPDLDNRLGQATSAGGHSDSGTDICTHIYQALSITARI